MGGDTSPGVVAQPGRVPGLVHFSPNKGWTWSCARGSCGSGGRTARPTREKCGIPTPQLCRLSCVRLV